MKIILIVLPAAMLAACAPDPADVVFRNGPVYTVNEDQPWAAAVAVTGNRIVAVLEDDAGVDAYVGDRTRVIDLDGRLLLPGFVDGHVHFNRAGSLLLDANLLQVADDQGLRAEIGRVAAELDPGEWITGGMWGAYEEWAAGFAGRGERRQPAGRWHPDRRAIDGVTPDHPVFVQSFDGELYLANRAALAAAGLLAQPVGGMQQRPDGRPTGLIFKGSPAIERLEAALKPKSDERLLDENRAALQVLRESGITEIHDITGDQQMRRYVELEQAGELTVRVWMRADLARAAEFNRRDIRMGTHPLTGKPDPWLRWGAYKGYIDGIMGNHTALFFEPYDDQPDNHGRYRRHTSDDPELLEPNLDKIYDYLLEAHRGGFVANVHAIGTKGTALMLDLYERLREDIGMPLTGYRIIHAQVLRPGDFPRFRRLNVYAEVNPYHLSDDLRWMEERIGHERSKGAYAFRSLLDNGAELVFGSDWPGTRAAYYEVHPKYLIHAAVNRTTVNHTPEGGWFPEQKISVEEAVRAYTRNGACAAFDCDSRGAIEAGKLADLVVLDKNLFAIDPADILTVEVDLTMVDGQIVYERR